MNHSTFVHALKEIKRHSKVDFMTIRTKTKRNKHTQ